MTVARGDFLGIEVIEDHSFEDFVCPENDLPTRFRNQ